MPVQCKGKIGKVFIYIIVRNMYSFSKPLTLSLYCSFEATAYRQGRVDASGIKGTKLPYSEVF